MLKKSQLEHIEKRLLEERARALRSLGLFDQMAKADRESADSDLSAYTDHMADQGTESMEREKAALFATKEGRYLYRIEEADELVELGLDDYLYDGALLIEWPERLGDAGWPGALSLAISGEGDARVLTAEVPAAWGARWPLR